MNKRRQTYLYIIGSVLLLLSFVIMSGILAVPSAQAAPLAAESPTVPVTQPPPTETFTPVPPTATFTPGPTDTLQPPQTVTPPPPPVPPAEIPEPITVILFGTGLAALSAAAASRRNKKAE